MRRLCCVSSKRSNKKYSESLEGKKMPCQLILTLQICGTWTMLYTTLRLFPAVPINGRVCSETTTLPAGGGGTGEEPIPVPRGALIGFSRYACQRSTRYYGDDDEFPTRKVAGGQREGSNSRFHISSLYPDGGFQGHCTRMRGDRKDRSACRPAREAKCCSA